MEKYVNLNGENKKTLVSHKTLINIVKWKTMIWGNVFVTYMTDSLKANNRKAMMSSKKYILPKWNIRQIPQKSPQRKKYQ